MYLQTTKVGRLLVQFSGSEFRITKRMRPNLFVVGFLSFWLIGWFSGEMFAFRQIIRGGSPPGAKAFLIFWFIGWTIGGALAISIVLWNLFGKEIVTFTHDAIKTKNDLFSFGKSQEYSRSGVRKFGVFSLTAEIPGETLSNDALKKINRFFRNTSSVRFEYEGNEVKCLTGMTCEEADKILMMLRSYNFVPEEKESTGWDSGNAGS